jgi:hypothetical protein
LRKRTKESNTVSLLVAFRLLPTPILSSSNYALPSKYLLCYLNLIFNYVIVSVTLLYIYVCIYIYIYIYICMYINICFQSEFTPRLFLDFNQDSHRVYFLMEAALGGEVYKFLFSISQSAKLIE